MHLIAANICQESTVWCHLLDWSAESWAQDGRQRSSHRQQRYFPDGMRR